jgi:hypothetical protein
MDNRVRYGRRGSRSSAMIVDDRRALSLAGWSGNRDVRSPPILPFKAALLKIYV